MSQLVTPSDFKADTLRFQKPINGGSPNTFRIPISAFKGGVNLPSLYIATPSVFSFGVSPQANIGEKVDENLSNVKYYTLPMCLHSKTGPTPDEEKFVDLFNQIVDACKAYLCTKALNEDLGKFGDDQITPADLKKLNPLYYKKDKGVVVAGTGPILYPKLIMRKDGQSCVTSFTDSGNTHRDFKSLINRRMHVRGALKLDSIFVGSKVSLQFKVYEVNYKAVSTSGPTRLLADLPVHCPASDDVNDDQADDTIHD
jgi:hypothetical protein